MIDATRATRAPSVADAIDELRELIGQVLNGPMPVRTTPQRPQAAALDPRERPSADRHRSRLGPADVTGR